MSDDQEIGGGSFFPYSMHIRSNYNKELTNKPADPNNSESIDAWVTMIHEWVHFMQFSSSSFGFLFTIDKYSQLTAFQDLCQKIKQKAKKVYFPLSKAQEQKCYPQELETELLKFNMKWYKAGTGLARYNGILYDQDQQAYHQVIPETLLVKTKIPEYYRGKVITTASILEPIALGCQGQWLMESFGHERGGFLHAERLRPLIEAGQDISDDYFLLQMLEGELGINVHTRMILHDISLLLPFYSKEEVKRLELGQEIYSPPARYLAALELIGNGVVDQVEDSEADNYLKMYNDIAEILNWQNHDELLTACLNHLKTLEQGMTLPPILNDFVLGFEARLKRPDTFTSLTFEAKSLYEGGWQPIWYQSDEVLGFEKQPNSDKQIRFFYTQLFEAVNGLVTGATWKCPILNECSRSVNFKAKFPGDGPSLVETCICRAAVTAATGNQYTPEEIEWIE